MATTVRTTAALQRVGDRPQVRRPARDTFYSRYGKRMLDVVLASALIVVLASVYAAVWLAVRICLGQPIHFTQERVGHGGRRFEMRKFRTMKPDRRKFVAGADGSDQRRYDKDPDDPRHTWLGRRLRRCSLDELPQLVHVLQGEMSLVGPRPEIWSTAVQDDQLGHSRELVRPGVTGRWQVDCRDSEDTTTRLQLDDQYVQTVSLRTDLEILVKTARVVAARTGV